MSDAMNHWCAALVALAKAVPCVETVLVSPGDPKADYACGRQNGLTVYLKTDRAAETLAAALEVPIMLIRLTPLT